MFISKFDPNIIDYCLLKYFNWLFSEINIINY